MAAPKVTYGPLARGVFYALVSLTIVVNIVFPQWTLYYLGFLIFLAVGLRPFLERSGLYSWYQHFSSAAGEKRWQLHTMEKREEVDRKVRHDKLRRARRKDKRLPKNW